MTSVTTTSFSSSSSLPGTAFYLSMAIPVMVSVDTSAMQTGTIPESWQAACDCGPGHRLYTISASVIGDTTVHSSRSLTARFTIRMLFTYVVRERQRADENSSRYIGSDFDGLCPLGRMLP